MADRPLAEPLPADLPEDWTSGQIVAPAGADVGLSQQHGYNYLMEQVNATQRALNMVNESFDTISGKRTCRFVIGTSTNGWTQADCDYLCDGVDDQVEIQAAIDAAPSGGCEIVLLDGEYHLGATLTVKGDIWLRGNGAGTRLLRETEEGTSGINYMILLYPGARLSDLEYDGQDKGSVNEGGFEIIVGGYTVIENVCFRDCGYGCIYVEGDNFAYSCNIIRRCRYEGLHTETHTFIREGLNGGSMKLFVEDNIVSGAEYLLDQSPGGQYSYAHILRLSGNFTPDNNTPSAVSIALFSDEQDNNYRGQACVIITNNYLSRIEVTRLGDNSSAADPDYRGALIYGNVLVGSNDGQPFITLGENTVNNFVFGNTLWGYNLGIVGTILDKGTNNIVCMNSNDPGGGSGGGTAGVSTFNGRSGAVRPQTGDYTAAMVGAIPTGSVASIQTVTQAEYDALAAKNAATLYLIKE